MNNLSVEKKYLVSLLRCALTGEMPIVPDEINYESLYRLALEQSVILMVYAPVVMQNNISDKVRSHFEGAYAKATVKYINQDFETQQVIRKLVESKIKYLPLKGFVLKNLYPIPYMRTSCDVDILYQPKDYQIMRDVMISCGYSENSNHGNHAVFFKLPVMNIEMHDSLYMPDSKYNIIFTDLWDRVKLLDKCEYGYRMTPEDLYLHLVTHTAKHFESGGTGIRTLTDMYVLLKHYGDTLNRAYITEKLNLVNLNKFAENMELTTKSVFVDYDNIDEIDNEVVLAIVDFLLSNGSYGTIKSQVATEMIENNNNKFKVFFKRVFIKYDLMVCYYKWLKNFKFLLPVAWVMRMFRVVFCKPEVFKSKLKTIVTTEDEYISQLDYIRKISGI